MARDEQLEKSAADGGATDERANLIITVVLMAIFLTWIGCAIAVWAGWAI